MNILFLASRPPWPPIDGGRVVMAQTVDGLLDRGHHVTVVTPADSAAGGSRPAAVPTAERLRARFVADARPPRAVAALLSLAQGRPLSVAMQPAAATRMEVARLLAAESFDVVHVEQLQALPKADAAFARRVPVILRAENVESDLWRALAATRPLLRPLMSLEAGRLARFEARALRAVAATVALTGPDAARLRQLEPDARVFDVPAPMPADLAAGEAALPGDPPLVIVASRWYPNQDGVRWFLRDIWPDVFRAVPGARLHVFGVEAAVMEGPGTERHDAPPDSRAAFARGAILIVPLRVASGVRVRILEAWARGIPVIATRAAVSGLGVTDGQGVRVASSAETFARAIRDLHASPAESARLVADGHAVLTRRHDPADCAARLEAVYSDVTNRVARNGPTGQWRGRRDSNPRPLA